MVNITAALVKELRKRTGAAIMECKKSLILTQGNIELAIDNMRKSGQAKSAKKSGKISSEGMILIKISHKETYGIIIELNCETDFVAKNKLFTDFGNQVITTAMNENITDLNTLKLKFETQQNELSTNTGENINIRRIGILHGETVGYYLHGTRIGVIVSTIKKNNSYKEITKHLAMHIVANKPEYVNESDIPVDVVSREYNIYLDKTKKFEKTSKITEKIVKNHMRKFISEVTLTEQNFVIDPSKTVYKLLEEHQIKVNNFIRFEVGEGI